MTQSYDAVTARLRVAYDRRADERERNATEDWKQTERQEFLDLLQVERRRSLLEVGSGPGKDSLFFQERGLDVTCTDLSPAMVELCRQKGLRAYVRDFLDLGFAPASFDAVYALNCLLHVPKLDLPAVLASIERLLIAGRPLLPRALGRPRLRAHLGRGQLRAKAVLLVPHRRRHPRDGAPLLRRGLFQNATGRTRPLTCTSNG